MPIMVERSKWILYKHIKNYEIIKAVALDVKNNCVANVGDLERQRMMDRLSALSLYKARNNVDRPLDSINHRINTLEFFMFGYEDKKTKRFIFSPLGNLFLSNIHNEEHLSKIFATMLCAIQFHHWANRTPNEFQLYPFRLIFKLLMDDRLEKRLYNAEYAYILPFIQEVNENNYNDIVDSILEFRIKTDEEKIKLLKEDEHTYVNCIYEWQYYVQAILKSAGILDTVSGDNMCKLFHPQKTNSHSNPTSRYIRNGYVTINGNIEKYVQSLINEYSPFQRPVRFDDDNRMQMDIVKEIYSFYPIMLIKEINGEDASDINVQLLRLPELISQYAENPNNDTAYLFEDVLEEGFNWFVNVEARKIGGSGHTDIECLYITEKKKFAVEAKSTTNKLSFINAGRLREHRNEIGGHYTIVITPRYVPAVKSDIKGEPIVIILANTFSEYLYNHIYHGSRDIDYKDFDDIIINNLGNDISDLISDMTMSKFATSSKTTS